MWGTKVNRVERKNIKPPKDIQIAMEKEMQAKREALALINASVGDAALATQFVVATSYLEQKTAPGRLKA